tara:strand:+ start:32 stop:763 length:732 start_codon:yes stop_codon:yes gene_type:complete
MQERLEEILRNVDDSDYGKIHRQRFIESYKFLDRHMQMQTGTLAGDMRILDLASYGTFASLVKEIKPWINIAKSDYFDLRYPFPIADNTYDVVCFMEALEHLKDQDSTNPVGSQLYLDDISEYSQSGIKNCMREIARILKPGGILFLTTPNINSWTAVHRALNFYSPTFYIPHVKEFSVQEIHQLHREVGLKINRLETPDNCHGLQSVANNRGRLGKLIEACILAGYSPDLRGDCIFSIATKI